MKFFLLAFLFCGNILWAASDGEPTLGEATSRLQSLKTKMELKEESYKKLIHEKDEAKTKTEALKIIEQMKLEHKEWSQLVKEYDEMSSQVAYRFPERAAVTRKEFPKKELRNFDEFQEDLTRSQLTDQAADRVKRKYHPEKYPDEKKIEAKEKKKPERDLTKPTVLQK